MRSGTDREVQTGFWGEPRRRAPLHQGQVLLVEKLRARRQVICDMLARERFGWGFIENAQDAVWVLAEGLLSRQVRMPELIICNARVVGEPGLSALARLRARRPDVHVIVFSAFTSPKLREAMSRIWGARVFDQDFGLADLRAASLALAHPRRRSG